MTKAAVSRKDHGVELAGRQDKIARDLEMALRLPSCADPKMVIWQLEQMRPLLQLPGELSLLDDAIRLWSNTDSVNVEELDRINEQVCAPLFSRASREHTRLVQNLPDWLHNRAYYARTTALDGIRLMIYSLRFLDNARRQARDELEARSCRTMKRLRKRREELESARSSMSSFESGVVAASYILGCAIACWAFTRAYEYAMAQPESVPPQPKRQTSTTKEEDFAWQVGQGAERLFALIVRLANENTFREEFSTYFDSMTVALRFGATLPSAE